MHAPAILASSALRAAGVATDTGVQTDLPAVSDVLLVWGAVLGGGCLLLFALGLVARRARKRPNGLDVRQPVRGRPVPRTARAVPPQRSAQPPRSAPVQRSAPAQRGRPPSSHSRRLHEEAGEVRREAEFAIAAAKRAETALPLAQERSAGAQRIREETWRAYEQARQETADVERAAAQARQVAPYSDGDTEREREVSRAALDAYRRGDLSVEELREVWHRTNGVDPAIDQHERKVVGKRSAEHRALRAYQTAADAERRANEAVDVATVAAKASAEEAVGAVAEARAAKRRAVDWDDRGVRET